MGFGYIFAGYLSFLFLKVMPPAMLVGAYLMYKGFCSLSIYGKKFVCAKHASLVLCAYFAIYTALWIGSLAGVFHLFGMESFSLCDSILYYLLLVVFHVLLYAAFEDIAKVCEFEKGIKKIRFCRVLTATFISLTVLDLILTSAFKLKTYVPPAVLISELVWFIYTAGTVYSFYRHIATDEQIAEEEKKIAQFDARYGRKK